MLDITDRIEAGIPSPPAGGPDVQAAIVSGRRAVRRRRFVAGTATVAVAAIVGGGWTLGPGADPAAHDRSALADRHAASADPSVTGPSVTGPDEPAGFHPATGELVVHPGWTVTERVEDPVTGPAPSGFGAPFIDDSVGLVLTNGSAERWALVWWVSIGKDGGGAADGVTARPGQDLPRFDRWLNDQALDVLTEPRRGAAVEEAALLEADGTLVVEPGWEVAERIEDPAGTGTLAADVASTDGSGRHQWFLWTARDGSSSIAALGVTDPGVRDFRDWVDESVARVQGGDADGSTGEAPAAGDWPGAPRDDLVSFPPPAASSVEPWTLVPLDGVTILRQQAHPALPDSFADPDDVSAVALVEKEGERWFVLARDLPDGPPQYIGVPSAQGGHTIAEFLDLARARYAEGGGGLL